MYPAKQTEDESLINRKRTVRVLGIDPGIALTGWGCIERGQGGNLQLLGYGCVKTTAGEHISKRLRSIYDNLTDIFRKWAPDIMVVEEMFFTKNTRVILSIGHARGVAILSAALSGVPVTEYNPRHVKQALTGYGSADKFQIQKMVQQLLSLKELPKPDDAADALAIAMCHLQTFRVS